MERVREALVQLVGQAYPDLAVVTDELAWLSGSFTPPAAFVYTELKGEVPSTLTGNCALYDGAVVLHYGKNEQGTYQPISSEPLTALLRQERFQYAVMVEGERVLLCIDQERFSVRPGDRLDRLEISFPLEVAVKLPKAAYDKLETFEIEWGG